MADLEHRSRTKHDGHREWTEAFAEEMAELGKRRPGDQDLERNLVGLAFSGGGIRSATFGLGVLEGLKERDQLKGVDYLSTVSGGGYVGAWLSANCKRQKNWLDQSALWHDSIGHLRRYSNYLSPTLGFFSADTWSMATIWLRNTLLVQATVVLAIASVLMLPRPMFEAFQHWPGVGNWRWATILLFVLGVVGVAGNQLRLTSDGSAAILRAKSWPLGLAGATLAILAAWIYAGYVDFSPFQGGVVDYWAAGPVALLLMAAGFLLQPVAVRLLSALWPGDDPPQQINYTQNWVQGIVVIPLMVVSSLVAAILWGESTGVSGGGELAEIDTYGEFLTTAWQYWPFPLSVVFVSFWVLSFGSIRDRRDWRGLAAAFLAPFVAVPVNHALLCAIMLLLHGWAANAAEGAWRAFVWGPPLVALAFVLTIVALIGMMGRQSTEGVREWWSRLGAWLGIYATAWMVIAVAAVYGPAWVRLAIDSHPLAMLSAGGGWIGTVAAGLFAGNSESTGGVPGQRQGNRVLGVIAAVAPYLFIAGLLLGVSFALDELIRINTSGLDWSSVGISAHEGHRPFLLTSMLVWAGCLAGLLLFAARVDINDFSLNAFYRNRLVRCYLGASRCRPGERNPQNFTGFDDADDIALADLVETSGPSSGPLHIVNCALNLGGSSDLALHTRHSAAFTLNPLYCGSGYRSSEQSGKAVELGYIPTWRYGGPTGAPTLGQAISVSGAAASPNMGYHTSPVVAFMLTVFNVRLGWWFPNPGKGQTSRPSPQFGLRYLFAELFGGANDRSAFVAVSDGGHFENLAAYELVRRRCRVVIVSDGECDPRLAFEGLGTLIRMCAVDFGATITIDVAPIRPGKDSGWSAQRWATGRIQYADGTEGKLIYLKASMTGREDTSVLQYKASHASFPHETTADQFYREDQFESYRRLGREVALEAFGQSHG